MKRQLTLIALVAAVLPVVAQASVASHEAMNVNHEPLAPMSAEHAASSQADALVIDVSGVSDAMAQTQRTIARNTAHKTSLPQQAHLPSEDQPRLGHGSDW
ncbi:MULTISPECIES: hypothetical protein [unclassified Modicisalibacter]|uniref:hypothetical protein n=1 Tax=unclassified Modicisalibacter TaxID=2679913 RepID=UPI001CCF5169|nr:MULTISPECIES: hypothetical protein [unclassified Modicisalibacter]MBZ9558446.1 hypothetical protein [Modicisalibacter sp. R2A 31.J]MBZ9575662.1 hypothetical protein [Modicisalibacter sp. MOD 31.J]